MENMPENTPQRETQTQPAKPSPYSSKSFQIRMGILLLIGVFALFELFGRGTDNSPVPQPQPELPKSYGYSLSATAPNPSRVFLDAENNTTLEKPGNIFLSFKSATYGAPPPLSPELAGGAPLSSLITITPEVRGMWTPSGNYALVFTPEKEWPAAQKYEIKLARELFAPDATLDRNTVSWQIGQNRSSF